MCMAAGDMQPHVSAGGCKAVGPGVFGCTTNQQVLPEVARGAGKSEAAVTATIVTIVLLH